ncbi:OLC1v1014929C1 [Oldenlandia corymbosa var. corymbosa]|uniref:OLC1v1014929C1 n=1 Tax=Oldenlandia corymbosa var. corymbosa TaxID=529605 RepID=A0AAV1E2C2_OLDCO|nr:OLC1v1014929C1 [Oldenlandia corymbosa var. corymbosa]
MDGLELDWVGSSASWENPPVQQQFNSTAIQDIFHSIQLIHKNNSKPPGNQMFQQNSAPAFDHHHHHQIQPNISSWNLPQQKDATTRGVPDQICSDDFMMNQFSSTGLIVSGDSLQEAKAGLIRAARTTTAATRGGALDCLISASSSNTENNNNNSVHEDNHHDDHEFSMILSEYNKNLWNFQPFNTGVSSGESACNTINELDETASHNSTGQLTHQKPSTKRTSETLQLKPDINSATEQAATTFQLISDHDQNPPKSKKPRSEKRSNNTSSSTNTTISFQLQPNNSSAVSISGGEPDSEAIAQMKEMIYRAAAFRPVNFGTELMEKPKRKNVRISSDPQTVAARQRRERISERIRVLQKLVPGGSKMDTASMLDEAANYLKFLRSQVKALEALGGSHKNNNGTTNTVNEFASFSSLPFNHSFPVLTSQFPIHTPNYVFHNHPKI